MPSFFSVAALQKRLRACRLALVFLVGVLPGRAQYSSSFDSAFRSADAQPDPVARLARLRPLVYPSYEASVFQTLAFGKAFLKTATEVASDTDRYQAHVVLGVGYERSRDFGQAVRHGLESVRIAAAREDYRKQLHALQNVAFTYGSMGLMSGDTADFEKALHYCREALTLVYTRGLKSDESAILRVTGDVYGMYKKYDTAIGLYRRSEAALTDQSREGAMSLYMNLGIALNLRGDYEAALAAYRKADSVCDAKGMGEFYKMKIASNRAELYSDMGRLDESERLAKEILAEARESGATDVQVDVVSQLEKLCRKGGRYAEALVYSDTLAAIKERMLSAEKTGQVAEMQARYDAGVKDEQIAGQEKTIRINRRQKRMLWGGIGLLTLAGGTAFWGMARSRRLARRIAAQQEELLQQKAALQRMNETKDWLFGLIGHDLRTPLNSLSAYATLLEQQGDLQPEKARQYGADLRHTLGHTASLMENLLQFAKTQMQAAKPYPELLSLAALAGSVAGLLQPALERKDIRLVTDYAADTTAFADEDMTELILRNLLGNAIKYSATGGRIEIVVKKKDEAFVSCTVRDGGTGMKPELTALWNGPAVPAPVRTTRGTEQERGAGLGLMLSKTFAGLMGGSLHVESELGQGSEFTLLLPCRSPLPA